MSDTAMYICVLDEVPDFITPTLVGHSVLNHHLFMDRKYSSELEVVNKTPEVPKLERNLLFVECFLYWEWLEESYKKRVCRVNRKEFEKIKALSGVVLSHENTTLNGEKSCATIVVRDSEKPNVLKFAKLWSPKND